jgi:hypothetical protein
MLTIAASSNPPRLSDDGFAIPLNDFLSQCCQLAPGKRPGAHELLAHEIFLIE